MPNAVYQLTDWSQTNAFIDPKSQAQIILFNKLAAETESYVSRGSFIRRLIDKLLAPELSSDDLDEFELVGGAAATSAAATGSAATDSADTGAVSAATGAVSAATGAVSAVPAQDITPPAVRGQPPASEQPPLATGGQAGAAELLERLAAQKQRQRNVPHRGGKQICRRECVRAKVAEPEEEGQEQGSHLRHSRRRRSHRRRSHRRRSHRRRITMKQ